MLRSQANHPVGCDARCCDAIEGAAARAIDGLLRLSRPRGALGRVTLRSISLVAPETRRSGPLIGILAGNWVRCKRYRDTRGAGGPLHVYMRDPIMVTPTKNQNGTRNSTSAIWPYQPWGWLSVLWRYGSK
jgi:hypothetical protein